MLIDTQRAHVSPRMRPEACGLTHSRSGGAILLVEAFYKYQHPPFSFIHPSHTKITPKPEFCPIEDFLQLLRGSSAQINLSKKVLFFNDQVEVLSKISLIPWVQFSRSSEARYSTESPKNCPEAKEGAARVEFSPDQYQGRFCPIQDQSRLVHSSRPMGFG
ncbi:hypothetical protein F2Q69_00039888 [Brassica cretica]|uniref:Uncharacterized protein n=1 Tax=Brassica cretica TaxID=69181 RepID=A0A8S9NEX8_BRACR|nr:hypothetical protein F2Q69_00039888 [Brassica cretica]